MDTSETYRSLLRISTAVMAAVLMFQSGLIDALSTQLFSGATQYLGAAVGMSAAVQPTDYNSSTAELSRQQQLLAAREEAVAEREIAVQLNSNEGSSSSDRTTYLLAALLFVQLVVIVLNYGLDFLRAKEQQSLLNRVG